MYLWYLEKIWRKSAIPKVSGTNLCRPESAKSADFWLSGRRHVADMSATFPAKGGSGGNAAVAAAAAEAAVAAAAAAAEAAGGIPELRIETSSC